MVRKSNAAAAVAEGTGFVINKFSLLLKGVIKMKIAVTYENEQIFQHFGHTEKFKIYTILDGKIVSAEVIDTNSRGHGALAGFLSSLKADILICGGIGAGAQNALNQSGIKLYGGCFGNCDEAVSAFINGQLEFNPNVRCSHHDHDAHHSCGNHGCGSHNCG